MGEVTKNLEGSGKGHSIEPQELMPLVYEELRKLAAARMAAESDNFTLQPTALVHEAWLRLVGTQQPAWQNRSHFFAAAAEAMRRILIDRARAKQTIKRGAGSKPVDLDQIDLAVVSDDDCLLQVDEALEKLSKVDSQSAEVIKLRFFVGLRYDEAAEALGISERTAKRCWTFGRTWLYRELQRSKDETRFA
jgi:RNA polymerase sigma factor (TIGR02999 family)